ncbi:ABC transporter ATP-binding protein [Lagierella sp.]|uniref:ABC transporter ATP-binding protein n=1 Tax=Lagierella sp. TaxID=2849657 RepID=UPI0026149662|nr:ABC transporter ATP-binding protein [Lagierella sp.]
MKLEVKNISKAFKETDGIKLVLNDISFEVEEGEIVTLLGPSGCGKTTMLSIIAGFKKQDKGSVLLNDQPVIEAGPDKAFMFQNYALYPWMTVEKNILFPMVQAKMDKEKQRDRLEYLLRISRLEEYRNYYPQKISGGMKQRTALVRALAVKPEILLMDEPLGALDIEMRQSLQNELLEIFKNEKLTVIIVTHDVSEAIYLSDRVILMSTNYGEIILNEKIDLPYPRNPKDEKFKEYVGLLSNKFIEAGTRKKEELE